MNQRKTYLAAIREALRGRKIDMGVERLAEGTVPFWLRREGADLILQSNDDEFISDVFGRLFLPQGGMMEGDGLLLMVRWLRREAEIGAPRRLEHLHSFLLALAAIPTLLDNLFNAAMEVLAKYTQKPNTLDGWTSVNRITRRFIATYNQSAPSRLVDARLLRAALWSADLTVMRAFAEIGAKHASTPDQRLMVHYLLGNLVSFSEKSALRPLAEAMYAANPQHPTAVHNLAQIYHAECHSAETIAGLYEGIDEQANPNQFRQTVNWIAQRCYADGLRDRAAGFFAMLPAAPPQNAPKGTSWPQKILQVRSGAAAAGSQTRGGASLLDLEGLPPALAQPLEQAARLAQSDKSWASAMTADALSREFHRIAEHIESIPRPAPFALADCHRAAHRMIFLSRAYFSPYQHYASISPVPLAEKYGRIDIDLLRVSYAGLMSVAAAVAAIGLDSILAGRPVRAMAECLRLLDFFVGACLAAGMPDEALAMIARFESVDPCRDFALRLKELCLLAKGDTAAAQTVLSPADRERSEVHALIDLEAWTRNERIAWQVTFEDPESAGSFEVAWPDGRLCQYDHAVPPTRLASTHHNCLWLRRGEVICGRDGAILRPKPFHYPILFPNRTPDILAQGYKAVRLLRLGRPVEITEPVVILENFDALYHRNYYHWVVLLLSRINFVKESGLLSGRRLIVPEGLTDWMQASIQAVGVTAGEVLAVPLDKIMHLTDALLISSVEYASPSFLKALCEKVLPTSSAAPAMGPALYLSRRDQTRRALLNEVEIEALARDLSFAIVQPETLNFAEQARLFRAAPGIAAPEGAALTNTIFCKPGIRVLSLLNENDMFPTFNDLATVMGHHHRKLAGPAELDDYGVNYIWSPYRIDMDMAERHLRWVLGSRT